LQPSAKLLHPLVNFFEFVLFFDYRELFFAPYFGNLDLEERHVGRVGFIKDFIFILVSFE
jgi:hypothetical protein